MSTLVKSYTEPGYQEIPKTYLSEEEYEKAMRAFVFLCSDIVIVDKNKKTFYLAKRKAKPMNHWWFIGGRMNANETKEESAIRCFKRETGVLIKEEDLEFVALLDHRFKNREQSPQEVGCHTVSYVFMLPFEKINLEKINLEKNEYVENLEIEEFDRKKMQENNVFESMIDVYGSIFS